LLLRSAEGKPPSTRFVYKHSPFTGLLIKALEGVMKLETKGICSSFFRIFT
jgi:hypothetical protein